MENIGPQMTYPIVSLSDQIPISLDAFRDAKQISSTLERILTEQGQFLKENNLDPAIHMPQANWAKSDENLPSIAFRAILQGDYNVINCLRLFCPMFTGYTLAEADYNTNVKIPFSRTVPIDFDARYSAILRSRGGKLDYFEELLLGILPKLPSELQLYPPNIFGEVGWNMDGRTVNPDLYVYLERMILLHGAGIFDALRKRVSSRPAKILEIGGGYGALSYYLRRLVPHSHYIIIDLPESIAFSAIYLSTLFPHEMSSLYHPVRNPSCSIDRPGFTFVCNHFSESLRQYCGEFDLVINTLSLSEMSDSQVDFYAVLARDLLKPDGGIFFEQNHDMRHAGFSFAKPIVEKYFKVREEVRHPLLPNGRPTQGRADIWRL